MQFHVIKGKFPTLKSAPCNRTYCQLELSEVSCAIVLVVCNIEIQFDFLNMLKPDIILEIGRKESSFYVFAIFTEAFDKS